MPETIEVRCPNGPQQLFTKLKLGEEFGGYVHPGNLIEFTCRDCARKLTRERNDGVRYVVYHRFNFIGELVQTVVDDHDWVCGTGAAG